MFWLAQSHGNWLVAERPMAVLTAHRVDEVQEVIREVDRQVRGHERTAVGFLAYEAAPAFEPAIRVKESGSTPLAWFALFDHLESRTELPQPESRPAPLRWQAEIPFSDYRAGFAQVREAIARGDSYQANLTYRLRAPFRSRPLDLFAHLYRRQPTPFAAYIETGDLTVMSVSPELFFARREERIICRPMKGTAPRGRWPEEDRAIADELQRSDKNRAENLMIVDMVRNDLARIAHPGTVRVPKLFQIERHPTVWQMTSTVEALTPASLSQLLAALFPSASITGAPKIRTTELLTRLERSPRGVYTGAIGIVRPGGDCRFSVAIRTATVDHRTQQIEYGVGGGLVWDSDAESEYAEARSKALILTHQEREFDLLETIRWSPHRGFAWLDEHLQRLIASAAYFNFRFDPAAFRRQLQMQVGGSLPLRVRALVGADGNHRFKVVPLAARRGCVRLAWATEPVDVRDRLLFHKTTRRELYRRARAGFPDHQDVLLWNPAGEATESTISNLVVNLDGRLVTPPVASGLLPGTFRAALLRRRRIQEAPVTLDTLARARAIYLVNSVRGLERAELDWSTVRRPGNPRAPVDVETKGGMKDD